MFNLIKKIFLTKEKDKKISFSNEIVDDIDYRISLSGNRLINLYRKIIDIHSNVPFGKNRSSFNKNTEKNLIAYCKKLQEKSIKFYSKDFNYFNFLSEDESHFVYADPSYLITDSPYSRISNLKWNIEKEEKLLQYLDILNENNIKFALSNVLEHKGKKNDLLIDWCKKYAIIDIDMSYKNCSYQSKNNEYVTREVLIKNY
jgi:DNA adenine methylase